MYIGYILDENSATDLLELTISKEFVEFANRSSQELNRFAHHITLHYESFDSAGDVMALPAKLVNPKIIKATHYCCDDNALTVICSINGSNIRSDNSGLQLYHVTMFTLGNVGPVYTNELILKAPIQKLEFPILLGGTIQIVL